MENCNCENIEHIPPATLVFTSNITVFSCHKSSAIHILRGTELPCEAAKEEADRVWFVPKEELAANTCSWYAPINAVEVVR